MFIRLIYLTLITTFGINTLAMQDNCHFYRATNIFYEPRFDRDWLSTFDVTCGGGSADSGRNAMGTIVPLETRFRILETNLLYIQNLVQGFFIQGHFPVRSFSLGTQDTVTASGDLTIHGGYTFSYQQTQQLDFIDATARSGILIATSSHVDCNTQCVIPAGYNGQWGVPLSFDLSCGAYEWLTVAGHVSALFFINTAYLSQEPLWHVGCLVKADHILRGISCTLGYSYVQQGNKVRQTTYDPLLINACTLINRACRDGFSMHTLHLCVEFDCMRYEYWLGPRIALMYNGVLGGTSIFNTNMTLGEIGLEIAWKF
jgi:hypothetical protein